ncbi:MBG domain-containing protein [Lacticaseibacillus rhamnosus]|uniref:MBG domain-containing protein n=4 Tax=Lacticaseibacillus rhamnosus TaxID=47715 RepID=UPI00255057EA|nr:MBG domain-containing protein [Lacticaseibacillus rhamnosus]MDK7182664.1 MBG domain-containing protein [Lacticaseibacillus rhamnosus]
MKHSSKRIQSIQQAEKTVHVRFRMYKAKKRWLIAGTALLLMPAFFQPGQEVHADSKSPQTTAVTSQSGATAETTAKTATGNPQPAGTATQNTAAASSSAAVNAASSATQSSASSTASSAVASTGDSASSTSDATDSKSLATDSAAVKPQTVTQKDRSLASAGVQTTSATASSAASSASSQASLAAQSATTTQANTQAPGNAAAAENTQTIGDYTYSLDTANGTATVTGRANANVTDINIGASVTYNGQTFKVTAINNGAFATLNNLGNVNVADTVTSIGENAFAYSQFTGNITIENAESLGKAAFAGIKAGSVTLKKTANISERAFYFANVKDITIADAQTIEAQAFFSLTASSLKIDGQADIGESAFESANIAGDVTVNHAKTIGKNAFATLKAHSLTLDNPTTLDESAFGGAVFTGNLTINGAKTIGKSAFAYDKVTGDVTVSGSPAIGEIAFYGIQAATITIDGAQTTFDKTAFGFATADHVTVNVATLDHEAFYHLYTDQLTLGPDVRDITDGAFQFIQNTKKTESNAENDATDVQIAVLDLPANVKTISGSAFYDSKVKTIAVAANSQLTTLGFQAFAFSTATAINLPDSLEQIGDQAFYGGKLVKVAFGPKLQSIGNLAFTEFGPLENVDFTRATALETIGDSAFAYNTINNAITLPPKLLTIGNAAFVGNKIPKLVLDDRLKTIGDTAFGYNQIQDALVVPDSVTDIGKYAFVYNSISNLTLGNGLKTIGQEAFEANVILNAQTIPSSVTSIGAKAFKANLIPKVVVEGTPTIGNDAFSNNRITVLKAATAKPTTPDALEQNADAYTDSAHVSLSDFFDVAISGVTHQNIVVSNIKGVNGATVTFDTASKSFKMPAKTQGFNFDWSLKGQDGVTYTGHYIVHLDDPVIRAHDISLFTGQVWKPELNFENAIKSDGTEVPLSELTWSVTDEKGNVVASKDKNGVVTGHVDNSQPTTYVVTYTYGAESGSAKINYKQRLAASYALTGTQTVTATGSPITVDVSQFALSLGDGFDAGKLELSDLNFFDADGKPVAADALIKTGVYSVELSEAAWARIAKLTNDEGQSAAGYDFTGTSTAQLIIGLTATGHLSDSGFVYDGKTTASQSKDLAVTVTLSDGTQKEMNLTSEDFSLVEKDSANVGTYHYLLNSVGFARLQALLGDTVTIDQTAINQNSGKITITPAPATVNSNSTDFEYDGKTKASEAKGIQATVKLGETGKTVDLTSADIVVENDGVDAGKYSYELSDAGKSKLQAATGNNYQLTADDLAKVTGAITITPATTSVDSNDVSFEYDGKTKASEAAGIQATIKLDTGKVVDLTAADIIVANDDVNAGQYSYQLSDAGKAKLQAATGNNYQLTADDLAKVAGTITITPAVTTVDSSDVSFEYDGKTKASEAKGIQATIKLDTGKVVDLTAADIIVTNDDVNAGQYSYQLSDAGKAKLQAATGNNYQLTADDLAKVMGTITITPAAVTADSNDLSFEYDGKTKASEAKGIQAMVKLGETEKTVDLTSADIVVANDDVNAGQYSYQLSDAGKAKLQAATGNNYQLTADGLAKVAGTITITPATTTADSNDVSFEYDGKTKASEAKGIQATIKLGEIEKTVDLSSADIIVANDGVIVGKYTYSLSDSGKSKLQAATGSNYQLTTEVLDKVSGSITITPAGAIATGKDAHFEYDGKTKASEAKGIQAILTIDGTEKTVDLTAADIVVADDGVDAGKYSYRLSDAGKSKLQTEAGSDHQLTADELAKVTGTITITPAIATANSNDVSFEYNGKTKASEAEGIQATVMLGESGQVVALTSADVVVENDGVDAGKYSYQLSDAGKAKLQAATGNNYQLTADDLAKVTGTITITPATTTVDSNDVSFEYDGKTKASEARGVQAIVKLGESGKTVALTLGDIVVTNDGVDAGQYNYELSDAGKAKLQAATGNNYQLTAEELVKVAGTITITPAVTTADSNDVSFEYDGKTKASEAKGIHATVRLGETEKTVDLTSADIVVESDGVDAGKYSYQLSEAGKSKLQTAIGNNYQLTADDLAKVTGTITITPATTTVDSNDVSFEYDGKTKAGEAKGIQVTVKLGETEKTVDLTSADIVVANDDVNAGQYSYQLSDAGKAKLQAATGNNYQLTADDLAKVTGTITITPAVTTADSNDVSFEYDGKTKASEAKGIQVIVKLGETEKTVDLTSADIVVANDDVNACQYSYQLSDAGKAKLQAATGNNYQLTADDLAKITGTITITPAVATADSNNVSFEYNGKTKASEAKGIQATVKLGENGKTVALTAADIVVINDGVNAGQYDYKLSAAGMTKLRQATGTNYQFKKEDLTKLGGTITITPATALADLNDVSFSYDGQTKASQAHDLTANIKLGTKVVSVHLNATDIVVTDDGVGVGQYQYRLDANGIAKLRQASGDNYQFDAKVLAGLTGTITIKPVTGAVTVNDTSFVYDGHTKASAAAGLQASLYLPQAEAKTTIQLTREDILVTNDGTAAGTYRYRLSQTGIAKLQKAVGKNYELDQDELGGLTGTITITPLTVNATVNHGQFQYNGVTRASQAGGLAITVQLPEKSQKIALTNTDIAVENDSVNVGTYTYHLTASGLAKLAVAIGPNYQVTDQTFSGTITITPAPISATLSGLQKKTYDGQPGTLNDDYYRLVLSDGTEIQLQAGDLIFVDGQAPVNPGSYAVTLSTSGLQRIKALLPNNLLKNVDTQQAIFKIVALPSPDPGTGTTPDTPGHHLPDTGTDTGTTPGTPDHHLPNTGTGTQQSEISTHNGTKHRLPQTGDTQSQTLSLMGLLLATMSGLFGLAGRKRKAHR